MNDPDACIHALFTEQVERTPDQIALVTDTVKLTYRELEQRANQVAHYLHGLGLQPDGLVGLCIERSPEMSIGLLGILKAGGAYVPLDATYPADRIAYMLTDAQIRTVLTCEAMLVAIPPIAEVDQIVRMDRDARLISQHNPNNHRSVRLARIIWRM